jgi:hypothetical protein
MKRAGKPWIHELAYIIHFSDGKIDIMKGYYDSAHLNTHVADKKWSWLKSIVLVAARLGKASRRSYGNLGRKARDGIRRMDLGVVYFWLVINIAIPTETVYMELTVSDDSKGW